MPTKPGINHRVNAFKGIACILVVFIHARFPSVFGEMVLAVARAAVPFFFMVSGYFAYKTDSARMISEIPRKAKHIAIIAFGACIYNFACMLFVEVIAGTNLIEWFWQTFSFRDIFLWIVWNNAIPGMHLWFLFALLYCYGTFYLLSKTHSIRIGYFLIPILLILCWIQSSFHVITMGLPEKLVPVLSRNWLFSGMPFFMMGHFLASKKEKIVCNNRNTKWPYILCFISAIGSIVELCTFKNQSEICLFTPLLATSCFVMSMQKPEVSSCFGKTLEKIGSKYSLLIYIVHWSMFKAIDLLLKTCNLSENLIIKWIEPIAVFVISLCVAFLFDEIQTVLMPKKELKT